MGFLAFNAGSQLYITKPGNGIAVSRAVMNTLLGGSSAAVVAMLLHRMAYIVNGSDHYWSLFMTINGGLIGATF